MIPGTVCSIAGITAMLPDLSVLLKAHEQAVFLLVYSHSYEKNYVINLVKELCRTFDFLSIVLVRFYIVEIFFISHSIGQYINFLTDK